VSVFDQQECSGRARGCTEPVNYYGPTRGCSEQATMYSGPVNVCYGSEARYSKQ
jgi:hypothetical protein